ncbi:hypothetical protein Barb7_02928 [Bacteroidales bacterium Barb7]|nr:hypothetical protein Barb7_02928 [Bacteroidales bacterium Barb7]
MKKILLLVCALTVLVSCSKDDEDVLYGGENANLVVLPAVYHEFKLLNTLTERDRAFSYKEGEFSYDGKSGVATFVSSDYYEAQAVQDGLRYTEFLFEFRQVNTPNGMTYQLTWDYPQPDKELWDDGILVTSVPMFTLKNTRTGVVKSYPYKETNLIYNEQGVAKFVSHDSHEINEIKSGLDNAGFQYEYREA